MAVVAWQVAKWDKMLEELRRFAAANGGNAHVKQRDPERKELAQWYGTQVRRSSQSGRDQYHLGQSLANSHGRCCGTDPPVVACCARVRVGLCCLTAGNGNYFSPAAPQHTAESRPCMQKNLEKHGKLLPDRKARLLAVPPPPSWYPHSPPILHLVAPGRRFLMSEVPL